MGEALAKDQVSITDSSDSEYHDLRAVVSAIDSVQAVIEFDTSGNILTANHNFLATLGYDLEEIEGRHHRMFCTTSYTSTPEYKGFWSELAAGHAKSGEFRRIKKNGDDVWINASYTPIKNDKGDVVKVVKFATDITAQKQASSEFEGMMTALNAVQAVIEFTPSGEIITANENFLMTVGYSLEEIKSKHHRMFCDPTYTESVEYKRFWEKLGDGFADTGEYKRFGKGGKEVWINASYNPIKNSQGVVYKVVKFATDVTESKLRQADFAGKLEAISKAQAIIEFHLDGTIIDANANFLATVGYNIEELRGRHHRMFCEQEYASSEEYRAFWQKLGRGEYDAGRYKRVDRNGKAVWIQASYNPVFDPDGKPFKVVKFATNISAQVELEQQVAEISEKFCERSTGIASDCQDVSRSAQSLGATTEEMSATIEELRSSIESIAANSIDADTQAKNTEKEAGTGSQAIEESITAMELINKSSEEIEDIVKVIGEIASQTNLLAFNAAIEAARAGEHGLGFSVVADEVRKLAERSSQATKEISKLISESTKRIHRGGEVSRAANEAFKKIVDGVNRTTQAIGEITQAAQEQKHAAKDVATSILQVAESAETTAAATHKITGSTVELEAEAKVLGAAIKRFKDQ